MRKPDGWRPVACCRKDSIRAAFNYCSMTGGCATSSSILCISLNQWTMFIQVGTRTGGWDWRPAKGPG